MQRSRFGFADDLNFFGGLQKFPQAIAEDGVVIGNEDANGLFRFGHKVS